jgi:hypothetical protein
MLFTFILNISKFIEAIDVPHVPMCGFKEFNLLELKRKKQERQYEIRRIKPKE